MWEFSYFKHNSLLILFLKTKSWGMHQASINKQGN